MRHSLSVLDLDVNRAAVPPREAATLVLVREAKNTPSPAIEVFCVVRHVKSGFLGGAVVFPGGKVDPTDRNADWASAAVGAPKFTPEDTEADARAFGIAVCREALEEAAILLTSGTTLSNAEAIALRAEIAKGTETLKDALTKRALRLDLTALHPLGRWVTPIAESRRFDTRFFLAAAPKGQDGAHDAHETTASFWAAPAEVLRRFDEGEIQLAPPTHRCLELLSRATTVDAAIALAVSLGVEPIMPKLVPLPEAGENAATMALVLPGDPEHDVPSPRVPGRSRFVLRGERWVPEDVG